MFGKLCSSFTVNHLVLKPADRDFVAYILHKIILRHLIEFCPHGMINFYRLQCSNWFSYIFIIVIRIIINITIIIIIIIIIIENLITSRILCCIFCKVDGFIFRAGYVWARSVLVKLAILWWKHLWKNT
jgi:hypothetical protein